MWSRAVFARTFRPEPRLTMIEWLEKWVVVPDIVGSTRPGPFMLHTNPAMRFIFEAYQCKEVHYITIMKAARTGGSMASILCILWQIANRPAPVLWVDPVEKTARRVSHQELQPYMLACKPVRAMIIKTKTCWTFLEMVLKVCVIALVGSNSPNNLAGRQAMILILNELDKLKDDPTREAPPAQLAVARTDQFRRDRKIIRNSTPDKPEDATYVEYLAGSQHQIYCACPRCGEKQRMTFFKEDQIGQDGEAILDEARIPRQTGQVYFQHCKNADGSWDWDKIERGTGYECQNLGCRHIMHQDSIREMVMAGEVRPHNPRAPREHFSIHLSAVTCPLWTLGELVKDYLQAVGNPGKMHHFYNSKLGLPFSYKRASISEKTIRNAAKTSRRFRRTTLGYNTLEFRPTRIGLVSDVQGPLRGLWWVIVAWDEAWNLWVLDWADVEAPGFGDLETIVDKRFWSYTDPETGGEEAHTISIIGVDMSYRTQEVYEFCAMYHNAFPMQGREGGNSAGLYRPAEEKIVEDKDLVFVQFQDVYFKSELYHRRLANRAGRGLFLPQPESSEGVRDGLDRVLIDHLTNERWDEKTRKYTGITGGRPENNHLGDCIKEAMVFDYLFEVERRLSDADLEEEERIKRGAAGEPSDSPA